MAFSVSISTVGEPRFHAIMYYWGGGQAIEIACALCRADTLVSGPNCHFQAVTSQK